MTDTSDFVTKGGVGTVPFLGAEPIKYLLGSRRASGYGSSSTAEEVASGWDGSGKTVLITGASAGLGLEAAKVLAARGADVVLAVRNPVKTAAALEQIRAAVPGAKVSSIELELGSLRSVKACADSFIKSGRPLHVLICNAGIMANPFTLSEDGYESQWATNHLGHHLLVRLLLPRLLETARTSGAEGRVVVLTSYGHSFAPASVDKVAAALTKEALTSSKGYTPFGAYGLSKLSNILFARQLNDVVLKDQPAIAVACHPGYILGTELAKHMLPGLRPGWLRQLLMCSLDASFTRVLGKTIPQGAATEVYAATAPAGTIIGGEYYADCNLDISSEVSHSRRLAAQLWDLSEELCADYLR